MAEQKQVNILVVDDRPDGLLAVEAVLNKPGYLLIQASSGQEALSFLLQYEFALILLDVQMPVMDGFETAQIIKQNEAWKHIPIIFLTAINKEIAHIYKGYECGAVDYLFKPFDPWILKSKVAIFVDLFLKNQTIHEQSRLLHESERREQIRQLALQEMESRRRYRNLADAIPHCIWKAKPDKTIDYFNQVWCSYTGLTLEQSKNEGWLQAIDPADRDRFLAVCEAGMSQRIPFETECRILRFDGESRWHLVRGTLEHLKTGELAGWITSCTDIQDLKEAQKDLENAREELETRVRQRTVELLRANEYLEIEIAERMRVQKEILEIRDKEQKRIGQDLHDGLAQQLAGIAFLSKVLQQKLAAKAIPESQDAGEMSHLIKQAIYETKRLARGFYPIELEKHGLFSALEELAINTHKQFLISCECEFDVSARIEDKNLATHLYRISQEAVHNAIRHGKARRIVISAKRDNGHFAFSISDDGRGFEHADHEGMGIRTMNYRAKMMGAVFSIQRRESGGTLVTCKVGEEAVLANHGGLL